MVTACAACGHENPPDARFCNGCGAEAALGRAVELFDQKGAPAYAAHARSVAATWDRQT